MEVAGAYTLAGPGWNGRVIPNVRTRATDRSRRVTPVALACVAVVLLALSTAAGADPAGPTASVSPFPLLRDRFMVDAAVGSHVRSDLRDIGKGWMESQALTGGRFRVRGAAAV